MTPYEKFIERMKELNASKPYMGEAEFNIAHGIKKEVEIPVFIARQSKSAKQIAPTIQAHTVIEKKKAVKKPTPPKPRAVTKPPKQRKHLVEKTCLKDMTPEEIKAHRSKLQRNRMKHKRANGWVEPPRTEEQLEERRAYHRNRHELMKSDPEYLEKKRLIQKNFYHNNLKLRAKDG